ncbi:MAG: acyl-ACP thioesterase [Treponema sp.]|jgi:acyl-ACP thioesterase|nr:acyl-ACP thioesterase [Treponema sp.]
MNEFNTPLTGGKTAGTEGRPPLAVWQETCTVRFGSIDCSDRLSLDSIFNFFQEAAISHAEHLGVGREAMARTNQVWILSRMSVAVDRRPQYGETIAVRTWPRGGEKLFALRDYDILDAKGKTAVRGRSGWLIIDMEKRRPLRPQAIMNTLPLNEGMDALPAPPAGLEERKDLQKTASRRALYSDVDYNGHVNNVRYVQWIQDTLEPELLEKADCMRLDINYVNEILPGETTEIWQAKIAAGKIAAGTAHAFAFEGRKAQGGAAAFRAELQLW